MAGLKKEGFVSVINLRLASEPGADVDAGRAAAQAAGLKYIHLPFNVAMPDSKVVDSFLGAVADKSNQPVFIHCGSANRVGGMWMIKRVLQDGWAMDRAKTEAEAIGLEQPAARGLRHRIHQQPQALAARAWTRTSSGGTATRWSSGSPTTSSSPTATRCCRALRPAT